MSEGSVVVRAFRDADEPAVTALWGRVFGPGAAHNEPKGIVEHKRRVQPELFLIAELAGDVVGTTIAGDDGHRGWLHLVAVSPDHRRAGIGRALVGEAARLLRERGVPKVNLQVRAENPIAVEFWRKMGFSVEERVSMGMLLSGDE